MRFLATLSIVAALVLGVSTLRAQDKTSAEAAKKLNSAVNLTSLNTAGIQPWHWKMDVTLYDLDSKKPQDGNIEAWFADGNMRTVFTLGTEQLTTLRLGNKLYRTAGDAANFTPLEIVFMNAMHPIPGDVLQTTGLKLATLPAGKKKLNCIRPELGKPDPNTFYTGMPLSYCFTEDTDQFVAAFLSSQVSILRAQLGNFQGRQVPVVLQFFFDSKMRAEAKTTALETFVPSVDDFALQPTLYPMGNTIELPQPNTLLGLVLSNASPHYPDRARSRHVQGSVIFDVIIGTNGRVLSQHVADHPDPDLMEAAKEAISHWIYRPYLVNGVPVQVKTKITINFNLN